LECIDGRPDRAREHAVTALALARQTGDRRTEAIARNALGATEVLLAYPERALEQHRLALTLADEIASRGLAAEAMIGLAVAYQRLRDLDRAGAFAGQALELALANGFEVVLGTAHRTLAGVHRAAGQPDPAAEHARAALASQRRSGHRPQWSVERDELSRPTDRALR
jgi:tetratricopeptide (TPR) repeat protein